MMKLMDDKSEIVAYNVPDMPIKSSSNSQSECPLFSVVNHWHSDFEFTYIEHGTMIYNVNGESIRLAKGQMIMVNSAQMHYCHWESDGNCRYISVIFHPTLIDTKIAGKYFGRITGENNPNYMIFASEKVQEKKIIDLVLKIYSNAERLADGFELGILSACYELCGKLNEYMESAPKKTISTDRKKLEIMHRMVGFIQQSYAEKITLQDIASSAYVCRSVCCEIFKFYLGKTPIEYLNEYRISKSMDLLTTEDCSITEAAAACGFGGSSYFAEMFKRINGCTPTEYRDNYARKQ